MALEQRHGSIDALHWCDQLASLLLHPEAPGKNSHYSSAAVHAKVDFDLVSASAVLRLRLASGLVLLASLLPGRSRLHAIANSYTLATLACHAQCRRCCVRPANDQVCQVCSQYSTCLAMMLTISTDTAQYYGWALPSGCLVWVSKSTSHALRQYGSRSSL